MELACLIDQYLPAFKAKQHTACCQDTYVPLARCCAVGHPMPAKYDSSAPRAMNSIGARVRVATVVAPSVRTMKRACGSTGNAPSYCRSSILW